MVVGLARAWFERVGREDEVSPKTWVCFLMLATAGWGEPNLPSPTVLLDSRAVSIGVVHARPDDSGFQQLFKTAWGAMRLRKGGGGSFLDLLSGFLSHSTQESMLLGLLPFQGVRIDHFDDKGRDRASFMVTLAGFQGLQSLFYNTLLRAPDGKTYPTVQIGRETLVIRPKPGQPQEEAGSVARVQGTFYSFADQETARRILEKKQGQNAELSRIFQLLDQQQDTYGVLLNRQDSLYRFFDWVNRRDFENVRVAVGEEKLLNCFRHVDYCTWQGDLISDDRMDMQVKFRADSPQNAEVLEEVLTTARQALALQGRMGDLQMTTIDQEVLLSLQFTGYRKMLTDYLSR
jgi:hypothetical protein